MKNEMTLAFDSISENEGFARVAVAAFVAQLNPTLEEDMEYGKKTENHGK